MRPAMIGPGDHMPRHGRRQDGLGLRLVRILVTLVHLVEVLSITSGPRPEGGRVRRAGAFGQEATRDRQAAAHSERIDWTSDFRDAGPVAPLGGTPGRAVANHALEGWSSPCRVPHDVLPQGGIPGHQVLRAAGADGAKIM